jgi:hypothetical protein
MPILSGFGVWDGKWAPYASYIIFELYQQGISSPLFPQGEYIFLITASMFSIGNDYYVRMIWNSKEMVIPECGGPMCPYNQFLSVMKQLIITDRKTQCSLISFE